MLYPENETRILLRNAGKYLTANMAPYKTARQKIPSSLKDAES
jgi:hypothetical protein